MSAAVLRLRGVQTFYGRSQALRGVDLDVGEREIVALIGANGAGKTTTLRTISGLLKPARGSISFLGREIQGMAPDSIVRLGLVHSPEGRRIFPRMSVLENLQLGAYGRSDASGIREDLAGVLELFPRLRERLAQKGGTLSGGEQQMLALARAVLARPRLLLLDEISMGLAPMIVSALFDEVRSMAAAGVTVLLVEQYVEAALGMADYAYVVDKGRVVDVGEPADLRSDGLLTSYLGA